MTVFLALLAILVPASVTSAGFMIKQSTDKQASKQQEEAQAQRAQEREQSNKRLEQDRHQSEARLRLDAAINAADLFSPTSDPTSSAARSAAGLLALTQLGQADLAVALLADLWGTQESPALNDAPNDAAVRPAPATQGSPQAEEGPQVSIGVSAETAIQVVNAALGTKDPNAQVMAAELLCRNARSLDISKAIHWPSEVNGKWNHELPVAAKLLIVDALVQMALASEKTNAIRELAIRLYGIWQNDPQPRVKGCVGTLIHAILPDVERLGFREFMPDFGQRLISLDEMKLAGDKPSKHPDGYFEQIVADRSAKLTQWAAGLTTLSTSPGTLAPASAPL
jgi:hypothetical protein